MTNTYMIADRFFQFHLGNRSFFPSAWEWKLDAFRVSEFDSKGNQKEFGSTLIDVNIYEDFRDVIPINGKLINSQADGFFQQDIFLLPDGSSIWNFTRKSTQEIYLSYRIDASWKNIILQIDKTETEGNLAFEYLTHMLPTLMIMHQKISFHGVLLEYNGKGYILSAHSGVGKTTRARIWRDQYGALILNGDRAVCSKITKGTLSHWVGYGTPWSGTSGEQLNRIVPIEALIIVERADGNNATSIQKLDFLTAYNELYPHIQMPPFFDSLLFKALDYVEDFLNDIPIIKFKASPSTENIQKLLDCLKNI